MTDISTRELLAERNRLAAANLRAMQWGAAITARHERIKEIDSELRARNIRFDSDGRIIASQKDDGPRK